MTRDDLPAASGAATTAGGVQPSRDGWRRQWWSEGYAAALAGTPHNMGPHLEGSEADALWRDGWLDAACEALARARRTELLLESRREIARLIHEGALLAEALAKAPKTPLGQKRRANDHARAARALLTRIREDER